MRPSLLHATAPLERRGILRVAWAAGPAELEEIRRDELSASGKECSLYLRPVPRRMHCMGDTGPSERFLFVEH